MRKYADTSASAYARLAPVSGFYRSIVLKTLFDNPAGLTVDEVCELAGYPRYSLQPRFSELLHKGAIRDTGRRRQNRSGAYAAVWCPTALDPQEAQA